MRKDWGLMEKKRFRIKTLRYEWGRWYVEVSPYEGGHDIYKWEWSEEQDGPAPYTPWQVAGMVLAPIMGILVATVVVFLLGWLDGLLDGLLNFLF